MIPPMLAHMLRFEKVRYPAIVQPKIDGFRAIWDPNLKQLYSRNGKEIKSVPHIVEYLRDFNVPHPIDGELYIHNVPFQDIASICSRKTMLHEDYRKVRYYVFDLIYNDKQIYRILKLGEVTKDMDTRIIQPVENRITISEEGIIDHYNYFVDEGYEGAMIRPADGRYEKKRSFNLLKMKTELSGTFKIIGFTMEFDKDGKPKGTLGAFILENEDGIPFKCGTGPLLTRENRIKFWTSRPQIIGMKLRINYFERSKDGIPRFPVAKEFVA